MTKYLEDTADIAGILVGRQQPTRIMGTINVSPESFFKGSVATSTDAIKQTAESMVAAGVDILDIGARGTAPYLKTDISIEEEKDRLLRAIEATRAVTDTPISVDTQSAVVAEAAYGAGANILNDISGLAHDPALAAIAKRYDGVILMANSGYTDATGTPVEVVKEALHAALERAQSAGIKSEKIVLDPGIGFFRDRGIPWYEWDRAILQHLTEFDELGRPLLIGLSRKSFIGKVLNYDNAEDRLYASIGLTSLITQNTCIFRTHDVRATKDAIRIAQWFEG